MFVRLALDTDESTFVELARLAVDESARHVGFCETTVRKTFRRYLRNANPTIFLVDDKRDIPAFLMATMSEYTFAAGLFTTQEVLFVRSDRRGTRAAALLIRELIRWSDRLGALEITGGNDNNLLSERTARFLKLFGFEQVGFFMRRNMELAE